jgi:hypothetical protein
MTPATTNELVSLEDVLRYRHPGVIRRYAREHQSTPEEAAELFRETLKWLYLCARAEEHGPEGLALAVHPEIEKIDWMWHTFLLFTRDYAEFCERHFGFFIHHVPNEDEDEEAAPLDEAGVRTALEQQYAFVYDLLGEETLRAWYGECRYVVQK